MSTTITVTSAAELNQALSQATGGETILLAAGDYGKLVLKNTQFASNVTIKSADPNAMASFSEVYLNNASNITFDEINFDYTYSQGDTTHTNKFQISYSSNITINNSIFDGDLASGTGIGKGLLIRGSSNVDVINTEFHSWWKALSAFQSSDLDFIGNNIHTIRSDGISLGEVQNVLIENNYIHDFGGAAGSGDHRDMIQIQRAGGTGSSDIFIRNNVLDIGAGDYAQGIWAGQDKGDYKTPSHWNYNIVVENNVLYNAHANGIALHMTDGAVVSNNTVIAVPTGQSGGVAIPKIIVGGTNATIEHNVAPAIIGYNGQSDWIFQNNVIAQNTNPSAAGYYDSLFVYHATSATDGYNQYGVIPGSAVDLQNAGSSLVDNYPFSYDSWVGSSSTPVVNPGGSGTGNTGSTGSTSPDTDTSAPSTPDTDTSTPSTPDTDTSAPSTPDTDTSTPSTPDTDTSTPSTPDTDTSAPSTPDTDTSTPSTPDTDTSTPAGSHSPMVFDDFVLDIAGLPHNGQARLRDDAQIVDTADGPVVHFDGHKDQLKMGRLREFENSEQIAFTVEFARDEADGSGQRLVWNKGHVGLELVGDGIKVLARNNDDKFHKGFRVDNLGLNDTDKHEITVLVDQNADRLQVLVDDQVVLDETGTDFDFVGGGEWGWDIGFSHNRYADGNLSSFAIDDEVQFVDVMGGSAGDFLG